MSSQRMLCIPPVLNSVPNAWVQLHQIEGKGGCSYGCQRLPQLMTATFLDGRPLIFYIACGLDQEQWGNL